MTTEVFTKWTEIFPCAQADALSIAKALVKETIPEKIYSDSGTHFVNNVITLMANNLRINLRNHCAYHPQSAGLVERHIGIFRSRLKKIMEETGKTGFTVYH